MVLSAVIFNLFLIFLCVFFLGYKSFTVARLLDAESNNNNYNKVYQISGKEGGMQKVQLKGVARMTCNPLKDVLHCDLKVVEEEPMPTITGIILDDCWVEMKN